MEKTAGPEVEIRGCCKHPGTEKSDVNKDSYGESAGEKMTQVQDTQSLVLHNLRWKKQLEECKELRAFSEHYMVSTVKIEIVQNWCLAPSSSVMEP